MTFIQTFNLQTQIMFEVHSSTKYLFNN